MISPNNIVSIPLFTAAFLRAKAVATATVCDAVSAEALLKGFQMLLDEAHPDAFEILEERERIEAALQGFLYAEAYDFEAASALDIPLDDHLRGMVSAPWSDIRQFVTQLVAAAQDRYEKHCRDHAEFFDLDDIKTQDVSYEYNDTLFTQVCERAFAAAKFFGIEEIGPEIFSIASFHSFLAGEFRDRPALALHVVTNRKSLEALAQERQWLPHHFCVRSADVLPLSSDLQKILGEKPKDALRAVINAGALVGTGIRQRRTTAIHEAGHAVIWFLLRPQVPIVEVSIVPKDQSVGRVLSDETAPYFSQPSDRKWFMDGTSIALAGQLAQNIALGADSMDDGAASDLAMATEGVWMWVAELGLDEDFGPVRLSALQHVSGVSTGALYDRAQERVRGLLKECADRTRSLLQENWHHVCAVADALVERGALGTEELLELLIDRGLANWPGVRRVRNMTVRRSVRFASEAGVHETIEGPVHYSAGDAIVTGSLNESWPIPRESFEGNYELDDTVLEGQSGWYRKRAREALALCLSAPRNVVLSNSRGVLSGNTGDWIVDHGGGDLAVVSREAFSRYYEILP